MPKITRGTRPKRFSHHLPRSGSLAGALPFLKALCKRAVPLVECSLGAVTLHASPQALMAAAEAKCLAAVIEAVKAKRSIGMDGDDA